MMVDDDDDDDDDDESHAALCLVSCGSLPSLMRLFA